MAITFNELNTQRPNKPIKEIKIIDSAFIDHTQPRTASLYVVHENGVALRYGFRLDKVNPNPYDSIKCAKQDDNTWVTGTRARLIPAEQCSDGCYQVDLYYDDHTNDLGDTFHIPLVNGGVPLSKICAQLLDTNPKEVSLEELGL